jgi:iron complex outermembrane receptor protein
MQASGALNLLLCLSIFSILATNSAIANPVKQSSDNIEEVIIEGTKQAYRGQFTALETPQSELTINSQLLNESGALTIDEALDLSSSVARQNNFGGLWNSFALRGFVGDGNLPSNFLVNGFNAGRGFGGSKDISGIESVEVLKGPRAALFGRGVASRAAQSI